MRVTIVDHPLVADRLSRLRVRATERPDFRRTLTELCGFLLYEATRDSPIAPIELDTPMGPALGARIAQAPILVPVLRAGLGMLAAALEILPEAHTGFIGLRRNEQTLLPEVQMSNVPADLGGRDALILDPMLATGGSAIHACETMRAAGAGTVMLVCVLAAPEGLAALRRSGTADAVVTAAVDDSLNDVGFILPGLGDAGDRQFGPNP